MKSLKQIVMTYDQFCDLKSRLEKFITFSEDGSDLSQKLSKISSIYSKLSNMAADEEMYIAELTSEKAQILATVQDDVKRGRVNYDNKEEMSIKINGDVRLKELNIEIGQREIMVNYIRLQQKNLTEMRYDITNFIKWEEYKNGKI